MKKTTINFSILLFFMTTLAWAQTEIRKVTPPRKIEYENKTLTYDPAWKDQETNIEADIDNDADKEIIISFVAANTFFCSKRRNTPY